jgi:hypothetical protein
VTDSLCCLFTNVGRLAEAGVVSREDADRWSDGLRAGAGHFFCSYTGFLVRGVQPRVNDPSPALNLGKITIFSVFGRFEPLAFDKIVL